MMDPIDPAAVSLIALYAETHFRFLGWLPSLIYRPEPEIVFDLPHRLAPDRDLPILLLVNDVHRFPAEITDVTIAVSAPSHRPIVATFTPSDPHLVQHSFSDRCRAYLFTLSRDTIPTGMVNVNCRATARIGKRTYVILNDNLPLTSKAGYTCMVANSPLPGSGMCLYGDLHVHSQYSESHVEFGPPVRVIDAMAHAYGLDFLAITDHSYDLMCRMDNYLEWDEARCRWPALRGDLQSPHVPFKTTMLLGEEISCLNSRGRVVHLCGVGMTEMINGSLDGARPGREKQPQPTIPQVAEELRRQGGLAIAAHPGSRNGLLAKLLIRRGIWEQADTTDKVDGYQGVNNSFGASWLRAKRLWVTQLLKGVRLPLVAGNDCHGDFNRYRAIGTPLVTVRERENRFFGACRTGVYSVPKADAAGLLRGIRDGATFVTSGPAAWLTVGDQQPCIVGRTDCDLRGHEAVHIGAESTEEFGNIGKIKVLRGRKGDSEETVVLNRFYKGDACFTALEEIRTESLGEEGYLRAEVVCMNAGGQRTEAYTSPCWYKR